MASNAHTEALVGGPTVSDDEGYARSETSLNKIGADGGQSHVVRVDDEECVIATVRNPDLIVDGEGFVRSVCLGLI